jgi:small-conductance mechanosensitive channel
MRFIPLRILRGLSVEKSTLRGIMPPDPGQAVLRNEQTFDVTEKIKLAFDENNVSIPFPQMDVHLQN